MDDFERHKSHGCRRVQGALAQFRDCMSILFGEGVFGWSKLLTFVAAVFA